MSATLGRVWAVGVVVGGGGGVGVGVGLGSEEESEGGTRAIVFLQRGSEWL